MANPARVSEGTDRPLCSVRHPGPSTTSRPGPGFPQQLVPVASTSRGPSTPHLASDGLFPGLPDEELNSLLSASLADSTRKAYSASLERLARLGIRPPFTQESVNDLLLQARQQQLPFSMVTQCRAAMTKYNSLRDLSNPFENPLTSGLVTGFKNLARKETTATCRTAAPALAYAMDTIATSALSTSTSVEETRQAIGLFLAFVGSLRPKTLFNVTPEHITVSNNQVQITLAHEKTGNRMDQLRTLRFAASASNPLCQMLDWLLGQQLPANLPIWPATSKPQLLDLLRRHHHPDDRTDIALNSLRPGGASCARLFTSLDQVKQWGNWTSSAVDRYLRSTYTRPATGTILHQTMSQIFAGGT